MNKKTHPIKLISKSHHDDGSPASVERESPILRAFVGDIHTIGIKLNTFAEEVADQLLKIAPYDYSFKEEIGEPKTQDVDCYESLADEMGARIERLHRVSNILEEIHQHLSRII